ncbi:hypothetical protein B0H11DRAFT_2322331 [Mycena galericulata]|nr:hypothetical protein B0H11DRAFT_2322331 [Mycena galericulata]
MASSDQCAVGPDGQLLPASAIVWYDDPDDKIPLPSASDTVLEGRGHRQKSTSKLAASLRAEKEDDDGNFIPVRPRRRRASAMQAKATGSSVASKNAYDPLDVDDSDDEDFETDGAESSDIEEVDANGISMEEISEILPSKTIPERPGRSGTRPQLRSSKKGKSTKAKGKRKQRSLPTDGEESDSAPPTKISRTTTVETVTDDGNPGSSNTGITHPRERLRNPVYNFFEESRVNKYGVPGDTGDKHYKCCHGSRKIITVKKSQKHSVNGLVSHLQRKFPPMYRLYDILKNRDTPPTADELAIASGINWKRHPTAF